MPTSQPRTEVSADRRVCDESFVPRRSIDKSGVNSVRTIQRSLKPGLYKLVVDAAASRFDWESLYFDLNQFGNLNQRTGPWDFDLRSGNSPLLPAYWVYVNDRKIGLWYFNRISTEQVRTKRMRGEAQFWIQTAGNYEFRFESYRPCMLEWADVRLEVSSDDTLLEGVALQGAAHRGLQNLFNETRWQTLAKNLQDPAFPYGSPLQRAFDWALTEEKQMALPLLAARYRLRGESKALDRAKDLIEKLLAAPAWGNPQADGYGHNGDMVASYTFRDLTIALNFLNSELDPIMVGEILARLEKQGDVFLELALLNHGYWGGSVIQEHGFTSFTNFTTAAYALVGWLPRAEHWLRFALPRMERTWRALPTDGVIPTTSYHLIGLFIDKVVLFRELHRQATGQDVYTHPSLHNLVDYCVESYIPETCQLLHPSARGDHTPLNGHAYFGQMARTFMDAEAAWLAQESLRHLMKELKAGKAGAGLGTLFGALLYEPLQIKHEPRPARRLKWFQDSGSVVYRDDSRGILFSTRCGAPNSGTSHSLTNCPCDRSTFARVSGSFVLARNGRPLIQTAEGGYSMRSELGNVVLIDGQGQLHDLPFPMSYPDAVYGGERIEAAHLHNQTGPGYMRMDLGPAYDPDLSIQSYQREWFFEADGRLRLIDTIRADKAHRFTWLFQTYRSHSIERNAAGVFSIANENAAIELGVERSSTPLIHSVADTLSVWAYRNDQNNQACQHLAFETKVSVQEIVAAFCITPIPDGQRDDQAA